MPTLTKEQKKGLWTLGVLAVLGILYLIGSMGSTARLRNQIREAVEIAASDGTPELTLLFARRFEDDFNKAEEALDKYRLMRSLNGAFAMIGLYDERHDAAGSKRWLDIQQAVCRKYGIPTNPADWYNGDKEKLLSERFEFCKEIAEDTRPDPKRQTTSPPDPGRRERIKEFTRQIDEAIREKHERDRGR
jgi:hypothetical protein